MSDNNETLIQDFLRMLQWAQEIKEQRQSERAEAGTEMTDQLYKLHEMLDDAGIPHKYLGGQLVYYGPEGEPDRAPGAFYGAGVDSVCSVIDYGYGSDEGLLEISGLMTEEEYEETGDSVLGWLTAENVFERIKKHFESSTKRD